MPSQYTALISLALPSTTAIAPSAHAGTHSPQPSHSASSIRISSRTGTVTSLGRSRAALRMGGHGRRCIDRRQARPSLPPPA